MNQPDPDDRPLSAALNRATDRVDWSAFGGRLRDDLASTRPRRAAADVVCAGGHLLAAAGLLAVAVGLGAALFGQAPRQAVLDRRRAAPIVANARSPGMEWSPGHRDEPLSVDALLAQLPAAMPDADWLAASLR